MKFKFLFLNIYLKIKISILNENKYPEYSEQGLLKKIYLGLQNQPIKKHVSIIIFPECH